MRQYAIGATCPSAVPVLTMVLGISHQLRFTLQVGSRGSIGESTTTRWLSAVA
jgi:hypothetical protein